MNPIRLDLHGIASQSLTAKQAELLWCLEIQKDIDTEEEILMRKRKERRAQIEKRFWVTMTCLGASIIIYELYRWVL